MKHSTSESGGGMKRIAVRLSRWAASQLSVCVSPPHDPDFAATWPESAPDSHDGQRMRSTRSVTTSRCSRTPSRAASATR